VRLFIELFALIFALLVIYRRLIEPFIEGISGLRKSYNKPQPPTEKKFSVFHSKKNIEAIDPKKIQDAEFEEIK